MANPVIPAPGQAAVVDPPKKNKVKALKKEAPYSSSGGKGGASKKITHEEFEDRTLSVFRCGITHERTRKLKEIVVRVRVPDARTPGHEIWAVFIQRVKPELADMFDMHTLDAKVDVIKFPVSMIAQREHLTSTPFKFYAMLTKLFLLVDFLLHRWLPGKSPIKKMSEDEIEELDDPVLKDLLAVSPEAEEMAGVIREKAAAEAKNTKSKKLKVKSQERPT